MRDIPGYEGLYKVDADGAVYNTRGLVNKVFLMASFHRLKKEVGYAVLEKYGHKCTACGVGTDLCIHHKNRMKAGDPQYNDIENLTVLCRSCHMRHHRLERDIRTSGGRRGRNPPIKCKFGNCSNLQHGKGYCKKHYATMFREKQGW